MTRPKHATATSVLKHRLLCSRNRSLHHTPQLASSNLSVYHTMEEGEAQNNSDGKQQDSTQLRKPTHNQHSPV